jgi:hypothetical protein
MPARTNRYSVHVKRRDQVEYKDRDRTVVFRAGMLDGEVYLGREQVTAGRLDPDQREEIIERVYHHLNVVRQMGLTFINEDASPWRPRAQAAPERASRLERRPDLGWPRTLARLLRRITGGSGP